MGINVTFNDFDYQLMPKQEEIFNNYSKIIQWGRANPVAFIENFMNIQFTDMQRWVFLNTWRSQVACLVMGRNSGKALSLDTKVWTLKDNNLIFKTIGDLKQGDYIFDANGKLSEVIHLNPVIFDDYYEVEFSDGEKIKCNADHLWLVHDRTLFKRNHELSDLRLLNTDYIYRHLDRNSNNPNRIGHDWNFHVPIHKPIQFYKNQKKLPIDPYVLGYWLGDGCVTSGVITCGSQDVEDTVKNLQEYSKVVRSRIDVCKDGCYLILVDFENDLKSIGQTPSNAKRLSLKNRLKECEDLLHNKHIPEMYLTSSVEERLKLLQGLMDSDGTIEKDKKCSFCQSNKDLFDQVVRLIESLGMSVQVRHKITNYIKNDGSNAETWIADFGASKELPVFKLKRKFDKLNEVVPNIHNRKAIVGIKKINEKIPMRCITMRNDDGLFLCGEKMTVTHNSFLSAPYIMAKTLLYPNFHAYIMAPSGGQSSETFMKLENLAKNNIASLIGVSSFFLENCVAPNAKASPFVHDKGGYHVELFNGSTIDSLNSVAKNIVGIRSALNVYDEAGKIPRDFYDLTLPFTTQSNDFRTSTNGFDMDLMPEQMPNQTLLLSSAESTDTYLFDMYKMCFEKMLMGDMRYFVADISADHSLHPYINGKATKPLLTQQVIDDAMATNPYRAMREQIK